GVVIGKRLRFGAEFHFVSEAAIEAGFVEYRPAQELRQGDGQEGDRRAWAFDYSRSARDSSAGVRDGRQFVAALCDRQNIDVGFLRFEANDEVETIGQQPFHSLAREVGLLF